MFTKSGCAAAVVLLMSFARAQAVRVIEPPLQGPDIPGMITRLRKLGGGNRKGEYETTAAFKQRIATVPDDLRGPMIFPVILDELGPSIFYNADRQRLYVHVPVHLNLFIGSMNTSTVILRRKISALPGYLAENGFGVKKPVAKQINDEMGLFFDAPGRGGQFLSVEMQMTPEDAQKWKPFLCTAVVGQLTEGIVYESSYNHTPTMQEPWDSLDKGQFIKVALSHLMILDRRNGKDFATFPLR